MVLQEARKFNEGDFVTRRPAQCRDILTKLLYLLYQNNRFTSDETTKVFFGCTKLFQSKNPNLRRMLYLFIKELAKATQADEVIIVIQSLVKDMNSNDTLHAANAIRVLSKIVDSSMVTSIDRFFKQSIVHKDPVVSSAALVSGLQLMVKDMKNAEVVRRWLSEVNEAVNGNDNEMVRCIRALSARISLSSFNYSYYSLAMNTLEHQRSNTNTGTISRTVSLVSHSTTRHTRRDETRDETQSILESELTSRDLSARAVRVSTARQGQRLEHEQTRVERFSRVLSPTQT